MFLCFFNNFTFFSPAVKVVLIGDVIVGYIFLNIRSTSQVVDDFLVHVDSLSTQESSAWSTNLSPLVLIIAYVPAWASL